MAAKREGQRMTEQAPTSLVLINGGRFRPVWLDYPAWREQDHSHGVVVSRVVVSLVGDSGPPATTLLEQHQQHGHPPPRRRTSRTGT
jgi:hypothetical protein